MLPLQGGDSGLSSSTILGEEYFFLYGLATNSYIGNFGDGSLEAKINNNQANMMFGFLISDDLNNGQLPANLWTLLSDSSAFWICNWF